MSDKKETMEIEEKEFYLVLSVKEKYTSRELERQIDSGCYERYMLSDTKVSALVTQNHPDITQAFKDTYILDFLNLPQQFSEKDLQRSITHNLKHFILEFGKDFTFLGEEYRIQVGNNDYFMDVKKPHENPSVGVILCKSKDEEVVEYAISRNLSPALVAEYKTKLIDKKILQKKLHELFMLSMGNMDMEGEN